MDGWTILAVLTIAVAAWLLLGGFIRTYRTYRGVRVITCPENQQPAAVRVAISGEADLHLSSCSRWPEMAGCDEACLGQITANPHACRVQAIVASWYEGEHCHYCAKPIGEIVWHERPPAVLFDGATREWKDIPPQDLPRVFATAEPVCWACHLVETFRREHPTMVIERPRIVEARHTLPPSVAVY